MERELTEEDRAFIMKRFTEKLIDLKNDFTREDVENFMDKNDLDCLRFCDKCGKPFYMGYLTPDGDVYCSEKCLEMTTKEIADQYSDDEDCIFFTEWE